MHSELLRERVDMRHDATFVCPANMSRPCLSGANALIYLPNTLSNFRLDDQLQVFLPSQT